MWKFKLSEFLATYVRGSPFTVSLVCFILFWRRGLCWSNIVAVGLISACMNELVIQLMLAAMVKLKVPLISTSPVKFFRNEFSVIWQLSNYYLLPSIRSHPSINRAVVMAFSCITALSYSLYTLWLIIRSQVVHKLGRTAPKANARCLDFTFDRWSVVCTVPPNGRSSFRLYTLIITSGD